MEGLDRQLALGVALPLQGVGHDPGDEERIAPQPEGGLEPEADVGDVGGGVAVDVAVEADGAVAAVEDPVPVLPVELEGAPVLVEKPGVEVLDRGVQLVGAAAALVEPLEALAAVQPEQLRAGNEIEVLERQIVLGLGAQDLAPEGAAVQAVDEEAAARQVVALEGLELELRVVEVAAQVVEPPGQRAGQAGAVRTDRPVGGEQALNPGPRLADDGVGALVVRGADLIPEAQEGVGAIGREAQLVLVGGDAVHLAQEEGAAVQAVGMLDEQQPAPHPIEIVGQLLDGLELHGVEEPELVGALVAVVAIAQEGGDVALDEVVLELALEEGVLHQARQAEVEVALGEEDVDLGIERPPPLVFLLRRRRRRRFGPGRRRRFDRWRFDRRRLDRGRLDRRRFGRWALLRWWRRRGLLTGRRPRADQSGGQASGGQQPPERGVPHRAQELPRSCPRRSRNDLDWCGPRAAETDFSCARIRSSTASGPRPSSSSARDMRSAASSSWARSCPPRSCCARRWMRSATERSSSTGRRSRRSIGSWLRSSCSETRPEVIIP